MLQRHYPFWILIPAALACRPADEAAAGEDAIIGGRIDRMHRAVGEVGRVEEGQVDYHCTGTLVGPSTVLTAAHCLFRDGRRVTAPRLAFRVGGRVHAIARSHVAPGWDPSRYEAWEDAALLRLSERSEVPGIPIALDPPSEGDEAEVLGFGVTWASGPGDGTGSGQRRRARITLDVVTDREILYAHRAAGACYGDSGGPILQQGAVVGVTSRGTGTDCRGLDFAQRADVLSVWIGSTSRRDACIGWCDDQ